MGMKNAQRELVVLSGHGILTFRRKKTDGEGGVWNGVSWKRTQVTDWHTKQSTLHCNYQLQVPTYRWWPICFSELNYICRMSAVSFFLLSSHSCSAWLPCLRRPSAWKLLAKEDGFHPWAEYAPTAQYHYLALEVLNGSCHLATTCCQQRRHAPFTIMGWVSSRCLTWLPCLRAPKQTHYLAAPEKTKDEGRKDCLNNLGTKSINTLFCFLNYAWTRLYWANILEAALRYPWSCKEWFKYSKINTCALMATYQPSLAKQQLYSRFTCAPPCRRANLVQHFSHRRVIPWGHSIMAASFFN